MNINHWYCSSWIFAVRERQFDEMLNVKMVIVALSSIMLCTYSENFEKGSIMSNYQITVENISVGTGQPVKGYKLLKDDVAVEINKLNAVRTINESTVIDRSFLRYAAVFNNAKKVISDYEGVIKKLREEFNTSSDTLTIGAGVQYSHQDFSNIPAKKVLRQYSHLDPLKNYMDQEPLLLQIIKQTLKNQTQKINQADQETLGTDNSVNNGGEHLNDQEFLFEACALSLFSVNNKSVEGSQIKISIENRQLKLTLGDQIERWGLCQDRFKEAWENIKSLEIGNDFARYCSKDRVLERYKNLIKDKGDSFFEKPLESYLELRKSVLRDLKLEYAQGDWKAKSQAKLKEYCEDGQGVKAFFKGNWNRHHVKDVEEFINKDASAIKYDEMNSFYNQLTEKPNFNKSGTIEKIFAGIFQEYKDKVQTQGKAGDMKKEV